MSRVERARMAETSWQRPHVERDPRVLFALVVVSEVLGLVGCVWVVYASGAPVFMIVALVVVLGACAPFVLADERAERVAQQARDNFTQRLKRFAEAHDWAVMATPTNQMPTRWAWRMGERDRLHVSMDGMTDGYPFAVVLYWANRPGAEGGSDYWEEETAYLRRLGQSHPTLTVSDRVLMPLWPWDRAALNQGRFDKLFNITPRMVFPDILTPEMCRLLCDQRRLGIVPQAPRLSVVDDELRMITRGWPEINDLDRIVHRVIDALAARPPTARVTDG